MKLQIKFNLLDLTQALMIAEQAAPFADILDVGSLLIHQEGVKAVSAFKKKFPDKEIFADAKIADKGFDTVRLFSQAGATYVSILAGTYYTTIQKAANAAAEYKTRIVLDFLNATSVSQSAIDAKTLGVYAILLHRRPTPPQELTDIENWQQIKENAKLPIFIEGKITQEILNQLVPLRPEVVIIGSAITDAHAPAKEAENFKSLIL